jgi:hypothetical protein
MYLRFSHFIVAGLFPSQFIEPLFNGMSNELVMLIFEASWWLYCWDFNFYELFVFFKTPTHLIGVSKHVFCRFKPQGQFDNLEAVTKEVK